MPRVQTHLWFESQAEEAMKFYTFVFKDSKVLGARIFPIPWPCSGLNLAVRP